MWRWLTAILLLLIAAALPVSAQDIKVDRGVQGGDSEPSKEEETTGNDALPYTIAILSTAVVMIVIVKPTRKM